MIHPFPGYRAYLAASSANPGSSAATVIVTKGDMQAERTIKIADASLDEIILAGFELALKLVAEKADPVSIVVEAMWISLVSRDIISKNPHMQAANDLWIAAFKRRTSSEPMTVELLPYRPRTPEEVLDRERLEKTRATAYLTAFPKEIYLPPPGLVAPPGSQG
jgi:hypothetical protein